MKHKYKPGAIAIAQVGKNTYIVSINQRYSMFDFVVGDHMDEYTYNTLVLYRNGEPYKKTTPMVFGSWNMSGLLTDVAKI